MGLGERGPDLKAMSSGVLRRDGRPNAGNVSLYTYIHIYAYIQNIYIYMYYTIHVSTYTLDCRCNFEFCLRYLIL